MTSYISRRTLAPLGLVLIGSSALAQQSVVDHCKQSSSDADRIACLEAALLGKDLPSAPAEVVAVPAEQETQVDPPSMELAAGPADDTVETTAVPEAVAPAAEETVPTGIGAEQVIARNQTKDEQRKSREKVEGMVIAKYEWVPYERLVVTFENGQVWRQIKGDTTRIRTSLERNQTADISESGVSGYFLRLNEIRRTIRVERIR